MNSTNSRTWMTLRKAAPLAGLLAALFCAAAAAADGPPPATQPADSMISEGFNGSGPLKLTVNKSLVLHTKMLLRRVSVAQPDIADVNLVGPTEMLVLGRKPGATQIILWDDNDHSQTIDVVVNVDLDTLKDQFASSFPDAAVTASSAGTAVVLRGRAPNLQVAQQMAQLAAGYAPQVVNLLEVSGGQQVVLKVRFAEVSRNLQTNLGFNAFATDGTFTGGLNVFSGNSPAGALASSGTTSGISSLANLFGSGGIGNTKFELFLQALRTNGLIRDLAEPNLMAMSGQEASFLAGGEIPIPVPQPGSGGSTITIEYKEYGVHLSFLPIVMGDGRIRLKAAPEVSELDYSKAVTISGTSVPGLTDRKLQTTVELSEGQTFALAGLLQNNINANKSVTPILGDLPVLGALFRSVQYQRNETELVVLVTPYLAGGLNPDQIPAVPGQRWRYPSESEILLNQDLGGPIVVNDKPAKALSTAPVTAIHGKHGFAPVAETDMSPAR
jgi:pilus assembly protein CpaC